MKESEIQRILSAPLVFVQPTSEQKQKELFPDKNDGWFYSFGLASGQEFVGHLPEKDRVFTFRPAKNLIPDLMEIEWIKKSEIDDLGYNTICYTAEGPSEDDKKLYEKVLSPVPEDSSLHPITKIAFKYYKYHPMLERSFHLQWAHWGCRKAKEELLKAHQNLDKLLIRPQNVSVIQKIRKENGKS